MSTTLQEAINKQADEYFELAKYGKQAACNYDEAAKNIHRTVASAISAAKYLAEHFGQSKSDLLNNIRQALLFAQSEVTQAMVDAGALPNETPSTQALVVELEEKLNFVEALLISERYDKVVDARPEVIADSAQQPS